MADKILMAHGSGGKLMNQLIHHTIADILGPLDLQLDDAAVLKIDQNRIVFTTDSYTITPLYFKGGSIGSLAVNGTVNDLAVMGAKPLFLSCGLIIEEGLDIVDLKNILQDMKNAAIYAQVKLVTGDTKVVEKGKADRLFINTSGIGVLDKEKQRLPIDIGDKILINGSIGDHGTAIMAERNNLGFGRNLGSDCAPLNHLIAKILQKFPASIKFMRDATRGGVASVLNEIVSQQAYGIQLIEEYLPLKKEVISVCDILGIDPLYAANEGKLILVCKKEDAKDIIHLMATIKEGRGATVIGQVSAEFAGKVYLETPIGGKRMVPLLVEEQLPRIC